jgi:hypothetical protein
MPTAACLIDLSCLFLPARLPAAAVADRIKAQLKEETMYLRSVSQVQFLAVYIRQYI